VHGLGLRPRDIAIAGGDVWVISAKRSRITRLDAATMEPHGMQTPIGGGAFSIAGAGDTLWVALAHRKVVARIDAASGRVMQRLRVPVTPILVAADAHGVWVAGQREGNAPDVLFHYSPAGARTGPVDVPNDVTALTSGGGRAWLAHDGSAEVIGYDAALTASHRRQLLGKAKDLAYGGGRVWASEPFDGVLGRVDLQRDRVREDFVAQHPAGLDYADGRVFVASTTTQRLYVVNPRTLRAIGDPITTPPNPWAVEAGAGHVWVTGLSNTLTRIDY
jgi:streptogramin lyase